MKIYKTQKELLEKLKRITKLTFSPKTLELFKNKGYHRLINTINFMLNNDLKITNKNIASLYKREKHLRHTTMPKIETFEILLSNSLLTILTEKTKGKDIFDSSFNIFISKKLNDTKNKVINSLNISMKKNVNLSIISPFDYFHFLTLGNLIHIFKSLKPLYKKKIEARCSFSLSDNDLWIILYLRNSIAHNVQLLKMNTSGIKQYHSSKTYYTAYLESFLSSSHASNLNADILKHVKRFNLFLDKIKNKASIIN